MNTAKIRQSDEFRRQNFSLRATLRQHPLIGYFLLAFAFSWAVELPLVAV